MPVSTKKSTRRNLPARTRAVRGSAPRPIVRRAERDERGAAHAREGSAAERERGPAVAGPLFVPHLAGRYGVSLLIRVDQLPSAARVPGPWLAPPQVPSRLSPVPPAKNGPPQLV